MVKLSGTKDGKPFLFFGLEEGNIIKLKDGQPIVIDLKELCGFDGEVVIAYGETQEKIVGDLRKAGVLSPIVEPGAGPVQ